jgi:uncharacterized protein (DUF1697 family)
MAHVVFLRAANVGGKNVFRPAKLAAALERLDVVNVGAAGTFVVRARASAQAIRAAVLAELPFVTEMAVRPGAEIVALVRSRPFAGVTFSKDLRGWAAALREKPRARPKLPIVAPASGQWSVRFERVEGAFALGLFQRRDKGGFIFPNQVVEKELGVPATSRWWETLEKLAALLEQ